MDPKYCLKNVDDDDECRRRRCQLLCGFGHLAYPSEIQFVQYGRSLFDDGVYGAKVFHRSFAAQMKCLKFRKLNGFRERSQDALACS